MADRKSAYAHPQPYLARDEAAQVGVDIFHEGHVEQGEACLHGSQDVRMTSQRVVPPLRLPPDKGKETHQRSAVNTTHPVEQPTPD